jgi:hypothetical protein
MAERNNLIIRPDETTQASDRRSLEEIRQDIAERRESIAETVDEIGDRFSKTLNWREYLAEHPMVALGAAAGVGLLLSGVFKRRHTTSTDRIMYALADSVEDVTDRFRHQLEQAGAKKTGTGVGLGRTAKAAITATVTKTVTDYLTAKVNQSLQHRYEKQVDKAAKQGHDENLFNAADRAEAVQRSEDLLEDGRPAQVLREDKAREQGAS